jgi:hypothetical protein
VRILLVGRANALRVSIERPLGKNVARVSSQTEPQRAVVTGHGPKSHIGDFPTEEEAQRWIATKSKYWPTPSTLRGEQF